MLIVGRTITKAVNIGHVGLHNVHNLVYCLAARTIVQLTFDAIPIDGRYECNLKMALGLHVTRDTYYRFFNKSSLLTSLATFINVHNHYAHDR